MNSLCLMQRPEGLFTLDLEGTTLISDLGPCRTRRVLEVEMLYFLRIGQLNIQTV
jgi:hypothetical protein